MKNLQTFDEFLNEGSNFKQTLNVLIENDPNNRAMYAKIESYLNAKPNKIFFENEGPAKYKHDFDWGPGDDTIIRKFGKLELVFDKNLNVVASVDVDDNTTYYFTK